MISPGFWKDKRVFITGHTGFKGAWLSYWLASLGAEVAGYALPPVASPHLFEAGGIAEYMLSIQGDVRDLNSLNSSIKAHRSEIVLHLAAQALVRPSYRDPVGTYETNVLGTVNLLECCRYSDSVRAVIVVTSDKCYQNNEWVWGYRENDALGGRDPYSSSKSCAEIVTGSYLDSYFPPERIETHGVGLASCRAGNVIGGGDWAEDRLIPDLIRAFAQGQKVEIRNPYSRRPWQHVLEPLRGYLMLAERLYAGKSEFCGPWNFGPYEDACQTVGSIANRAACLWGPDAGWVNPARSEQPHEATFLKLDWSKAQLKLGWQPRWHITETLSRTVQWYRRFLEDQSKATVRQLLDHDLQGHGETSIVLLDEEVSQVNRIETSPLEKHVW